MSPSSSGKLLPISIVIAISGATKSPLTLAPESSYARARTNKRAKSLDHMKNFRKRRNDPSAETFALEDYPFYLMTHAMAAYYGLLEKSLKKIGVDQPRWRVLMILGAQNPSNMSELSDRAVIKNSTMTRLIQRMQTQGLVRAARHPDDNRISEVYLTPLGEARLNMVRDIGGQVFRHAFGTTTTGELSDLVTRLKSIIAHLNRPAFEVALPAAGKTRAPRGRKISAARRATGAR